MYKIIIFIIISYFSSIIAEDPPLVVLNGLGSVSGFYMKTRDNRTLNAFRGISFAEKPVRFQPPEAKQPWTGVFNASSYGKMCVQPPVEDSQTLRSKIEHFYWTERLPKLPNLYDGFEDCLNLNVYLPNNLTNNIRLPVLFYIHGGSFISGSSQSFTPEYLLDRDIVLVTVQYRLGPLGFLSMQNDLIPGNAGILDLIEALRWVKKHITQFNGDPNRVTVMGQSAGAALVTYLMLSPITKNESLIHGVIANSGAAIAPWGYDPDPLSDAKRIAELAGCNMTTVEEMSICLYNTSNISRIMAAFYAHAAEDRFQGGGMILGGAVPCITPAGIAPIVLTDDPSDLLEKGDYNIVPFMSGANRHDGMFLVDYIYDLYLKPGNKYNDTEYMRYEFPLLVIEASGIEDPNLFVTDLMESKYLKHVPYEKRDNFEAMLPGVLDYVTTYSFKAPGVRMAEMNSVHKKSSYWYSFNYPTRYHNPGNGVGNDSIFSLGITHSDEMLYLTPREAVPVEFTEEETKFSKMMVNLWVNFVTSGNPNEPVNITEISTDWPNYDRVNQQYLYLGKTSSVKNSYKIEYMAAIEDTTSSAVINNVLVTYFIFISIIINNIL